MAARGVRVSCFLDMNFGCSCSREWPYTYAQAAALIRLSGLRKGTWIGKAYGWDFLEELWGGNGAGRYNKNSLCMCLKFWKDYKNYILNTSRHTNVLSIPIHTSVLTAFLLSRTLPIHVPSLHTKILQLPQKLSVGSLTSGAGDILWSLYIELSSYLEVRCMPPVSSGLSS